ncbi:MAG: N-6 DNA methylase [Holophagales bacterium]|jgi:predicted helicase|nr:N-6 DNA methylase [Holophagales bacterium]
MSLKKYIETLSETIGSEMATEHSYRPALLGLLGEMLPDLTVINEPARQKCGMPDITLLRKRELFHGGIPQAYIETKDIGDRDLSGGGANKEQFDRYKNALDNIIFTDYLDFLFYRRGQLLESVRVAELKGGKIVPLPHSFDKFRCLLEEFGKAAPQRITSSARLAEIMAGKTRLMAAVIEKLLLEGNDSDLAGQMRNFRDVLVADITQREFAGLYAQTITYGMFAARIHDKEPNGFTREKAARLIPLTNPFLRKLFQHIAGYDLNKRLSLIVDDLAEAYGAADVREIMGGSGISAGQAGPIIHFYENFLSAYDPEERKRKGVYYTPYAVVAFIVRAVDDILQKEFRLAKGLADSSKIQNGYDSDTTMHKVQMLDPAAGTGTFLAEAVRLIHQKLKGQRGVWSDYVKRNLLPRLNGFELLMAPYTMAHTVLEWLLTLKEPEAVRPANITRAEALKAMGKKGPDRVVVRGKWGEAVYYSLSELKDMPQHDWRIKPLDKKLTKKIAKYDSRRNTAYAPNGDDRLRVFLTNALEEFSLEDNDAGFLKWLTDEANEANKIKRDAPVMVVMGNPPYSGESKNKGNWIMKLMEDYKKEPGSDSPLEERNSKWINDDYVKFIRLGQYFVDKNKSGIVAFITNHGFLDNPTFRGMRYSLLSSFDKIYIIDLHGNAKKKETAPDGGPDENVFNIQQGVSINIFVKTGQKHNGALADVYHYDLWGAREEKYDYLHSHDVYGTHKKQGFSEVLFKTLNPKAPEYFFVPKDYRGKAKYDKGFSVADLFPINSMGIATARDEFTIYESAKMLNSVIKDFLSITDEEAREKYNLGKDARDWSVAGARSDLLSGKHNIVPITYRPFDIRYTCYSGVTKGFHCMPRSDVMRHLVNVNNLALCLIRINRDDLCTVFVVHQIVDKTIISAKDNASIFPLYLYPDQDNKQETLPKPNLNMDMVEKIAKGLGLRFNMENDLFARGGRNKFTPIDLFDYIYAVLHSIEYREKYKEFLKIDFPRIPYPTDAHEFRRLAKLGAELRSLHLMEHPALDKPIAKYPLEGSNIVEKPRYETEDAGLAGRVWINDYQYFDKVPLAAWEYYIGGYQPAKKWLKDRQCRALTYDDIEHYQRIITALKRTCDIQQDIGAVGD